MSLLMFACKKTKTHIVKAFLRFEHIQAYHRDQTGRNAVHYAIENADEEES
ncbi:MAG: ankyrin repeat domain-containing protein [Bdellovibrionales bacterium]|nr:ankyrin repeat domain-containing protein [Bdellovibrionales bacterium]